MTTASPTNLFRLLLLSAIWGGSFLLIRIGAPVIGPVPLMEARVLLAAIFLAAVALLLRRPLAWRAHWRHYLFVGFFNSALPFLLFGYAALTLSAAMLSILNATSPLWGALTVTFLIPLFGTAFGWLFLDEAVGWHTLAGGAIVIVGTALVTGFSPRLLALRKEAANA